jgi:DnaJ family protein C protein 28
MMEKSSRSIDEQIRQAMERGEFSNLPGKGQPLSFSQNPHEDPAWGIAYRMLKSSGHTLPWIETRRGIEKDIEATRQLLAQTWRWRQSALDEEQPYSLIEEEWQRALAAFREKTADLNRRIFNYNLEAPSDQFKRRRIDPEREIEKIIAPPD